MAQWTLDQLYVEVGVYIDADTSTYLAKGGDGQYTDTVSFGKVKSALNRAKNKIAKERYSPFYSDDKTLSATLLIDTATLTKPFSKVKRALDASGYEVAWEWTPVNKIKLTNNSSGDVITLEYFYVPADLSALADVLDFPETIVDPRNLCYFAAYLYFLEDGNSRKANFWLSQWNDGFDEIRSSRGETHVTKDVYSW